MASTLQGSQVKTTDVTLRYARQTALGVSAIPATGWRRLILRDINAFGAEIEKNERRTLGQSRGASKASIIGLTAPFGYVADFTVSGIRDFIPGFCYARSINSDVTELKADSFAANGVVTLSEDLNSDQARKFQTNSLVWLSGAGVTLANGLRLIRSNSTSGNDELDTSSTVADGNNDPDNNTLRASFAGYRKPPASPVTWNYTQINKRLTIGIAGIGPILRELGLTPGQRVHLGSPNQALNAYQNAPTVNGSVVYGTVRCLRINNNEVIFDQVDQRLKVSPTALSNLTLDILFGEFIRNVQSDHADYCEFAWTFEQATRGLGDGTPAIRIPRMNTRLTNTRIRSRLNWHPEVTRVSHSGSVDPT